MVKGGYQPRNAKATAFYQCISNHVKEFESLYPEKESIPLLVELAKRPPLCPTQHALGSPPSRRADGEGCDGAAAVAGTP